MCPALSGRGASGGCPQQGDEGVGTGVEEVVVAEGAQGHVVGTAGGQGQTPGLLDPTGPVLRVPAPTRLVEAMRLPKSSAAFGVDWKTGNVVGGRWSVTRASSRRRRGSGRVCGRRPGRRCSPRRCCRGARRRVRADVRPRKKRGARARSRALRTTIRPRASWTKSARRWRSSQSLARRGASGTSAV